MRDMFSVCLDELTKLAVMLTPEEKRRQALQFMSLGMTTLPALGATQSKIMSGRWIPKGVHPAKFLGATALGGAFWGGALPTLQHMIARGNIQKAKVRESASKELRKLAPEGPVTAVKQLSTPT